MIFVTVGNSIKGVEFYRLIHKIDEIAGDLKEEVVAQIGFIDEHPKHIKWFQYLNFMEILKYFEEASLIIGHSGVGTVINAIAYKKPLILVPRSSIHGEHIDDHQRELALQLRGMEGVFIVEDVEELKPTILKVMDLIESKSIEPCFSPERARLISFIKDYVSNNKSRKRQ
ncbi:MAG: beta-1,4-galactosyltransferase [Syntrophus sp. (in: bacteria)]|nr:beta-1,4-galactosyltransferase [Syntrophus sp. (in: bacteria)]